MVVLENALKVYDIDSLVLAACNYKFIYIIELPYIWAYSCKTNKLRNIYTIRWGARNISVKKFTMYFKIKIILFIVNFRWNYVISYGQVQVQKWGFCINSGRFV